MKDGEAFASKYNSQQLKIREPNVVMMFSNSPSDVKELAKVRFRVFHIEDNQLQKKSLVRTKDEEKKKDRVNAESDSVFDDSMIKRIMDLQKECTELSNKYPSKWTSDLQEINQHLIEKCLNMRKESRQKEKETQELKQKLAEARKVRFETESKYQEMLSSYDDTD